VAVAVAVAVIVLGQEAQAAAALARPSLLTQLQERLIRAVAAVALLTRAPVAEAVPASLSSRFPILLLPRSLAA
jgi:hypothetical protein